MNYEEIYAPDWFDNLSDDEQDDLFDGNSIWLGHKCYQVCCNCLKVIQMNRFLVGSMHLCRGNT
jgi:hypothetical protein